MLGVFYCSEKGQATPRNGPAGLSNGRRRRAAGEAGTKCCPQGKGTPWAWHEQGTYSRYLRPDNICFLYIPQSIPRGLRHFLIRHISIFFPNGLQKDTLFLLRAYRTLCRCAFFAPWNAGIGCRSGAVRRPSGLENCLTKFQDWRKSE